MKNFFPILFLLCSVQLHARADSANQQDTTGTLARQITSQYISAVSKKTDGINKKLDKQSAKALAQLQKQEEKIIKKLSGRDSSMAAALQHAATARYRQLEQSLSNAGKLTHYIPGLDSLATTLSFLDKNLPLQQVKEVKDKIKNALSKTDALKEKLQKAEQVKQFLKERKQYLQEQLEKTGLAKQLKKINKQVYYYSQQLQEYKALLNDPKKIEQKALELLSQTAIWKEFFRKNSMLASLFRMPADPNDPSAQASLAGLQTRAQVNALIQQQIESAGPTGMQQFQQNIQAAQSRLNQLKDKVMKFGGSSSDAAIPEGFKPNNQKTKTFWQRIEIGTNLQNQKSNGLLPVTSDIGISAGYKLNDKSIIGVGGSFKLGWGRNLQNIKITGQGVSVRSFVDIKLKGSFWISGGYEMNYRSGFNSIDILRNYAAWQQSGLIGVSKIVSLSPKGRTGGGLFKKTKLMLLWDMLSYRQRPRTQPVVFRIGYNF